MKFFFCLGLVVLAIAKARCSNCPKRDELIASGIYDPLDNIPCIDPCDETGHQITDQGNCSLAAYCQWNALKVSCLSKKLIIRQELRQNDQDVSSFVSALQNTGATSAKNETGVKPRLFNVGGGVQPPFVPSIPYQPQPQVFPANCRINPYDPHLYKLLESPVNVPYCLRIPCSKSDPSLEVNRFGCLSQPGCAYDTQLANIRAAKGHAILPGVPVCHLAIRNIQFHKLVKDYLQKTGAQWNGLHTKCFLQQHGAAILKAPCGCEIISSLEYFGIRPKLAGWPGITETECHLINGCFKKNQCYFPATSSKVQIKSGEDKYRSLNPTGREIFGQPQCLPFDLNAKPVDYLNNYHSCRLSGCAVDPIVGYPQIRQQLCSIALSDAIPNHLKQKFWQRVLKGVIRADNWREELNKLRYDTCPPVVPPNLFNIPAAFSLDLQGRSSGNRSTSPRTTSNLFANFLPGCTPLPGVPGVPLNIPNYQVNSNPAPLPNSLSVQPNSLIQGNFPGLYPNPNPFPYPFPLPGLPIGPYCPYRPLQVHGYPPLTGSFAGCCQRHYCYIPRQELGSQFSGVAVYHSEWGAWSACSASCSGGFRSRYRSCVGKGQCAGPMEQKERCGDGRCPYFEPWGSWGTCTATCGRGKQTRSRRCAPSGHGCSGPSEDERVCNTGRCPVLSQWSPYTSCSATCGIGRQQRMRTCVNDGDYGCSTLSVNMEEIKQCEVFCGSAVEVGNPKCSAFPECRITKTYECQYNGLPGHCNGFQPTKTTRCYTGKNCWFFSGK